MKHETIIVGQCGGKAISAIELQEALKQAEKSVLIVVEPEPIIFHGPPQIDYCVHVEPRKKETRGWTKNNRHK